MNRLRLLALSLILTACQALPASGPRPGAVTAQTANTRQLAAQQARASRAIPNETIVRLRPGVDPTEYARLHGMELALSIGLNMYLMRGAAPVESLTRDSRTLWAEANARIELPALKDRPAPTVPPQPRRADQPDDPLLPAEYGFTITGTDKIWRQQPGRPEVIVAVVDSGIDSTHPEFQGQLLPGFDFTPKVPVPGGDHDGYGHGTHVAGVIGAKANNGIGIAGIAPGCKLLPVRIFDDFGHSSEGISDAAVIWAVDHGAKVINASWGSPMEGEGFKAALQYALSKDVVFVAAVGNSGHNDPNYPGASEEAIGVAATTDIDTWGSFSTWGDWVDLAAPGQGILSTYPLAKGNGYRIMEGTSMAAPFVTAAAALVRSQHPDWNQAQVKEQLYKTAKDVIMTGMDPYAGNGRVDIARAVLE